MSARSDTDTDGKSGPSPHSGWSTSPGTDTSRQIWTRYCPLECPIRDSTHTGVISLIGVITPETIAAVWCRCHATAPVSPCPIRTHHRSSRVPGLGIYPRSREATRPTIARLRSHPHRTRLPRLVSECVGTLPELKSTPLRAASRLTVTALRPSEHSDLGVHTARIEA
jgi:hypothetical protein